MNTIHTVHTLKTKDFAFEVDGYPGKLEDVFPHFHAKDRIGIVVKSKGGVIGAGAFLLAAVTRFYDFYRPYLGKGKNQLWIYPEFFVFHVEEYHMDHRKLDVWPSHRELVVENHPEKILEAINDRGITRLIVEDSEPLSDTSMFLSETLNSARQSVLSSVAFSPSGRVKNPNIHVYSCEGAERHIVDAVTVTDYFSERDKEQLKERRKHMFSDGRVIESFRKISLNEAIQKLSIIRA